MANIPPPVAPPQIVRADADELANMQLPANKNNLREERRAEDKENDRDVLEKEQHIPPPVAPQQIVGADDEHANMQLQANEDDGTEEQRR